jgi:hypothetical protein
MALIQFPRATLLSILSLALALGGCLTEVHGGTSSGGPTGATAGVGGSSSAGVGGVGGTSGTSGAGIGGGLGYGGGPVIPGDVVIPPCGRTGVDPGPENAFERLKYGFAAAWGGTATSKPGWSPPSWPIDATFEPNGHYSAHCRNSGSCAAFYYGSDDESTGKTYVIDDIQDSGKGIGSLQVLSNGGGFGQIDLKHISLSDDLTSLTFESWNGKYGPVTYDLHCTN